MKIKELTKLSIVFALILCCLIVIVPMLFSGRVGYWFGYDSFQMNSSGPTIEKLEKLSYLVTHKVTIADVLTASENNYKGSWIIKGDALLSVNLGSAEIKDKDVTLRRAKIILPQPRAIQPRVNHDRTTLWSIEKGDGISYWKASLGMGDSGKLRNTAMIQAQRLVEEAANSAECIKDSRERTEILLQNIYSEMGWNIEIEWRKE